MAPNARIIAVANCKGGCGKTTTAVNLSAEFSAGGLRVLLIDLDPQGHATLAVGGRGLPSGARAHDLLSGTPCRPGDVLSLPSLDLLPANRHFHANPSSRARSLADALAPLTPLYDAIVIDTPPAADLPMIAALAAAHHALVPTQLTPLARDGVARFAQVFFYVSSELNPGLRAMAILPVQVDLRTRVQQAALTRLIADFGPDRLAPAIRTDTALAEAVDAAAPIRAFRAAARGASDYARLADHLAAKWLTPEPAPAFAIRA